MTVETDHQEDPMVDTEQTPHTNISGAPGGGTPTDGGLGAEERSFQTKPGDTEPAAPVATEAEMSQTPDPQQTDRAQNLPGPDQGNR
jgi:hypothetical protein